MFFLNLDTSHMDGSSDWSSQALERAHDTSLTSLVVTDGEKIVEFSVSQHGWYAVHSW